MTDDGGVTMELEYNSCIFHCLVTQSPQDSDSECRGNLNTMHTGISIALKQRHEKRGTIHFGNETKIKLTVLAPRGPGPRLA
jgi:hypothetical protein